MDAEAAARSDARYRELVDAAPDGVAITRHGRFLYANDAALQLLGCSSYADLASRSLGDFMEPDDLAVMIQRTTEMLRDGARFPARDYPVRREGREVVAEIRSVVIDFEGGPAVLAFARDVTEARRSQRELERTQRLAALGTLIAGVAHEVNNPLSFATLGTEVLGRFFAEGCRDHELGREALASVVSGLDRVAVLVRELRAFARADPPQNRPTDLAAVLAGALGMVTPALRPRARLDAQLAALPSVLGDPGRLQQVFVNLLLNASQSFATESSLANAVVVRAVVGEDEVTVLVEDNGVGIAPENLPRVFDPFFTTKPLGAGTGLGLSICHAILTQCGGRIVVQSTQGAGTTVAVVLQRVAALEDVVPEATPAACRRARVLVVDDEPLVAALLRELLAPAHEVSIATSGMAALALLFDPAAAYDIVFCDLTMPDVSGATLFERVRARRPGLGARFVFMSGGIFTPETLEQLDGPDTLRLEKPFRSADVSRAIARALEG